MLNSRQQQILQLLSEHLFLGTRQLLGHLKLTRGRLNQLIVPLIRKGLVKREGYARATVYRATGEKTKEQLTRENWQLREKVRDLEKLLDERKIIERAKEIITAQFDIPPTEAYRKLQEQSMSSGRSMRQIAESILAAYGG